MDTFTVGLIQRAAAVDRKTNIAQALECVRQAADQGSQVISLSELFNSRYFCTEEKHERFSEAEPIPGDTTGLFQNLARELEVVLVVPIFERRAPGLYHNSAAVIDADGSLLGVYRKMHIPDDPLYYEKYYFTPGDAAGESCGFKVFQTRFCKLGVLICWDQWYPEAARITALLGAEVIFYPTAIGWHPREKAACGAAQKDAWQTIQRGHAIANGVFVAAVNRVGYETTPGTDGIEFFGGSFVADPFGRVLSAAGDQEQILSVSCERRVIEDVRTNWPFLRDRRIDAYPPICQRFIDS